MKYEDQILTIRCGTLIGPYSGVGDGGMFETKSVLERQNDRVSDAIAEIEAEISRQPDPNVKYVLGFDVAEEPKNELERRPARRKIANSNPDTGWNWIWTLWLFTFITMIGVLIWLTL